MRCLGGGGETIEELERQEAVVVAEESKPGPKVKLLSDTRSLCEVARGARRRHPAARPHKTPDGGLAAFLASIRVLSVRVEVRQRFSQCLVVEPISAHRGARRRLRRHLGSFSGCCSLGGQCAALTFPAGDIPDMLGGRRIRPADAISRFPRRPSSP